MKDLIYLCEECLYEYECGGIQFVDTKAIVRKVNKNHPVCYITEQDNSKAAVRLTPIDMEGSLNRKVYI
jgi:hypothetical protein